MNLDFVFKSFNHIRYENGKKVDAPNEDARRAIKVEPNVKTGIGYLVTIYNLDGLHPVWQNNIQMSTKQMNIIEQNNEFIKLKGYGADILGNSFKDYGITIFISNNDIEKISLHMFDRGIEIIYLKEKTTNITISQIENEFNKGLLAMRNNDSINAIEHFKKALELKQATNFVNDEWDSCCHFNLGEAFKYTKRYNEAIINLKNAITKKEDNEEAYIKLSDCYLDLETHEGTFEAISILKKCISLFPNNKFAYFNIGLAYFNISEARKSLEAFQKSKDLGIEYADEYINFLEQDIKEY